MPEISAPNKNSRCAQIKELFKETFRSKSAYPEESKSMERSLQTKTLIAHTTMMISRVGFSLLGQSYWQKAFDGVEDNSELN